MAWPIKSNPEGCWKQDKPESCIDCHYSQVDESNTWRGSQRCWDAQCVVLDVDRLSESEKRRLHLVQEVS